MTVHYSGEVTLTAADFKTVHKGVEIGVKCVAWDATMPAIAAISGPRSGSAA